jgi:hypothetical protein
MNVRVRVSDSIWIEEEVEKEVDAFKALSRLTEVFKHTHCGRCKSANVEFVCRKDRDDNDWLEICCRNSQCRAKLVFGQAKGKGGEIYPKIKWNNLSETQQEQRDDEREWAEAHNGYLPNGGWFVYKPSKE